MTDLHFTVFGLYLSSTMILLLDQLEWCSI